MINGVCSWFCADIVSFSDKILGVFYIKVMLIVGISVVLIAGMV